jgi:hypothetical protein
MAQSCHRYSGGKGSKPLTAGFVNGESKWTEAGLANSENSTYRQGTRCFYVEVRLEGCREGRREACREVRREVLREGRREVSSEVRLQDRLQERMTATGTAAGNSFRDFLPPCRPHFSTHHFLPRNPIS